MVATGPLPPLRLRSARVRAYELPDSGPFGPTRAGFWLILEDAEGRRGVGDAAGWPGLSAPHGELLQQGQQSCEWGVGAEVSCPRDAAARVAQRWSSPVVFAWETALLDLLGQRLGCDLAELLADGPTAEAVAVNALVDGPAAARRALERGFGTLKFKIRTLDAVSILSEIRQQLPNHIQIRADANGTLSVSDAHALLVALQPLGVQYVEDPIAAAEPGAWAELASHDVPLAIDKHADCADFCDELLARGVARVLVLKPMFHGGLYRCAERARDWQARGGRVVVTAALESAVGVNAALHLACALRLELACGLTSFTQDDHPPVVAGRMHRPERAGLGVSR